MDNIADRKKLRLKIVTIDEPVFRSAIMFFFDFTEKDHRMIARRSEKVFSFTPPDYKPNSIATCSTKDGFTEASFSFDYFAEGMILRMRILIRQYYLNINSRL